MSQFFKALFTPPRFPSDANKTRIAGYVNLIALVFMAAIVIFIAIAKLTSSVFVLNWFDFTLLTVLIIIYGVSVYSRRGYVREAGLALVVILWLAVNGAAFYGAGVRDSAFLANFAVLLAAGLLIGGRAAVILSGLTIAMGTGLALAELNGVSPAAYTPSSPLIAVRDLAVVFLIFAIFIYLLINGLERAIATEQAGTRKLEEANRDLEDAHTRIENNRNELLLANEQLKRRAERISTIANISKTLTLVQDLEKLLPSLVVTISQRFGYYHVGVYLLDDSGQVAILRAASGEGGRQMLRSGHRILTSSREIISHVVERGEARIALDAGVDPTQFANPNLPETRSQLALPLKVKEIVIGALDIQSALSNAFTEEDVSILTILADQAAIAIQNARSTEQALKALRNSEIASKRLSGKAWQGYAEIMELTGYRYDGVKPERLKAPEGSPDTMGGPSIPIRVRGHIIGHLKLGSSDPSRRWTEDEVAMAEATADRVALALEGARLLDDAQRKAAREAFLSEVSARLGTSFQLDSILRDTVQELGENFGNATVSFQLVNPSSNNPTEHRGPGNGGDAG